MSKTLYISDLDGTLLSPESVVTERSARLLNEVIAEGALFSIATARTPATVSSLISGIHMNIPAVVMTGAALWDPSTRIYSDLQFIPRDTIEGVVEVYLRHGLPTFLFTMGEDQILDIYHIGRMSELERRFRDERIGNPFKRFHVDDENPIPLPDPLDRTVLLYAMQPTAHSWAVYEDIKGHFDVNTMCYHDIYGPETGILEVFSPRATKAQAVRRLADCVGADRIVAFGDNINDLSVLGMADHAVAVSNAVPEVLAAAHEVIGANADDSVARYIADDFHRQKGGVL